jgi:hypothetical protein
VERSETNEEIMVRVEERETRKTGRSREKYEGEQCTYNISYELSKGYRYCKCNTYK